MLPDSTKRGFTLVEILVVIVILGIIAGIVIPSVKAASTEATQNVFATNLKSFHQAATYYYKKTGEFPPNASSGQVPSGMEDYVNEALWTKRTPIGGAWDVTWTTVDGETVCWVGVHFIDGASTYPETSFMQGIDALVDDGDLSAGAFIRFGPCQYFMKVQ